MEKEEKINLTGKIVNSYIGAETPKEMLKVTPDFFKPQETLEAFTERIEKEAEKLYPKLWQELGKEAYIKASLMRFEELIKK